MRRLMLKSQLVVACLTVLMVFGCAKKDTDTGPAGTPPDEGVTTDEGAPGTEPENVDLAPPDNQEPTTEPGEMKEPAEPAETKEPAKTKEPAETKEPAKQEEAAPAKEEAAKEETPAAPAKEEAAKKETPAAPAKEEVTKAAPAEPDAGEAAEQVTLGDPSLTSGIPGDGPLTVDQIRKFLAQPGVLKPLDVQLPMGLAGGRPVIPSDNPITRAKIELGRQLYFDTRLSADNTVSCASCHDPAEGYGKHTQFGVGIDGQTGDRNSPVSYNRILSSAQFWDGRAASVEEQAKGPIAAPIEMGNTHPKAVETVKGIEGYRIQFEAVFPDEGITIDTIAKAIATFERAVVTGPAPYDYFEPLRTFSERFAEDLKDLDGLKEDDPELFAKYEALKKASDEHPMSDSAKRGRTLFFTDKGGCSACHASANFTDELYHNLGVGMDKEKPDLGRYNVTKQEKDKGAFKTPTIRNVTLSAPYMHDGTQKTLEEVVSWYNKGGHPNDHLSDRIKKLNLTDQEQQDLVAFMKALEGPFPKVETGRLPQ